MNITMRFEGYVEQIIDAAVEKGVVKTKAEALRLGVLELNDKYGLVTKKLSEDEEDIRLAERIEADIASGKEKVHKLKKVSDLFR